MKRIILILIPALLIGCATTVGKKFDAEKISLIRRGQTTETQLVEWFGQPMSTTIMESGNRKHVWLYGEAGFGSFRQNSLEAILSTNEIVVDYVAQLNISNTNAPVPRATSPKNQ